MLYGEIVLGNGVAGFPRGILTQRRRFPQLD
jgi:hypothetical protein